LLLRRMRPQAISLGVASGVDAPFLDHSDQAGAQTVACGAATP
jgi:hypothetical protein